MLCGRVCSRDTFLVVVQSMLNELFRLLHSEPAFQYFLAPYPFQLPLHIAHLGFFVLAVTKPDGCSFHHYQFPRSCPTCSLQRLLTFYFSVFSIFSPRSPFHYTRFTNLHEHHSYTLSQNRWTVWLICRALGTLKSPTRFEIKNLNSKAFSPMVFEASCQPVVNVARSFCWTKTKLHVLRTTTWCWHPFSGLWAASFEKYSNWIIVPTYAHSYCISSVLAEVTEHCVHALRRNRQKEAHSWHCEQRKLIFRKLLQYNSSSLLWSKRCLLGHHFTLKYFHLPICRTCHCNIASCAYL